MKRRIKIQPLISNKVFKQYCKSTDYIKIASLEADLKRINNPIKKTIIKCKITKLKNQQPVINWIFDILDDLEHRV